MVLKMLPILTPGTYKSPIAEDCVASSAVLERLVDKNRLSLQAMHITASAAKLNEG